MNQMNMSHFHNPLEESFNNPKQQTTDDTRNARKVVPMMMEESSYVGLRNKNSRQIA
jgi:hypothetical protein